jgi:hypothetical protein
MKIESEYIIGIVKMWPPPHNIIMLKEKSRQITKFEEAYFICYRG